MSGAKTTNRWHARRGLAVLLQTVAALGPIALSVGFVWVATGWLELRGAPLWLLVAWWLLLSGTATGILIGLDRLARRLLPLVTLLQLSLVFPDQAPSRFRTAMGSLTTSQLHLELQDAREGRADTPAEAAHRLLRFVATLTAHDRRTRGHSERVRAYAQMIATELKLPQEDIDRLNWAALVHDVGKLAVPKEVLNKGRKLTEREWNLLRSHAEEGARLVAPLRPWLGEWCDAVGQHHERWDGAGYPNGLAGEEISLGGRIVAVADVFDVMTSHRSYKAVGSVKDARRELTACAGSQFDPSIVRAFVNASLGRVRVSFGPLAWLANAPVIGQASISSAVGTAAGSLAIASTAFLGVLGGGALAQEPAPPPETAAVAAPLAEPEAVGRPWQAAPVADAPARQPAQDAANPPAVVEGPGVAPSPAAPETPSGPWDAPDLRQSLTEDIPATITIGLPNPGEVTSLRIIREPDFGQISVAATDTLRYVPEPDFNGLVLSGYEACWADGSCDTGLVSLGIAPVNDDPVAVPDTITVGSTPELIDVLANDVDVDGDALSLEIGSLALAAIAPQGSLTLTNGYVRYSPPASFTGTDVFEYRVSDGNGGSDTGRVEVTVAPDSVPPTAGDDLVTLSEGGVVSFGVLDNDSANGGTVTLAGYDDSGIVNGSLRHEGGGNFTYTASANFVGTESFAYTIVDGRGAGAGARVGITVAAVNDPPTFTPGADVQVYADAGPQNIPGWATGISPGPPDEAGQSVSFTVSVDQPDLFTTPPAVAADGTLTFTPDPKRDGSAAVTVQPVDGGGTANGGVDTGAARTATITVNPPVGTILLNLGPSGPSADEWDFLLSPPAAANPVPDTDLDGQPGLTIAQSSGSDAETDGSVYQDWVFRPTRGDLRIDGPINLRLWASKTGVATGQSAHVWVYLYECNPGGTNCTSFNQVDFELWPWDAEAVWLPYWTDLGWNSRTIPVGSELRLRLLSSGAPLWLASAYPRVSRLRLSLG